MHVPDGFFIFFLVFITFIGFSIYQIKRGKDDIKYSRRTKWLSKLRIIFATILLIWFSFLTVLLLGSALNFIG